jgi:hypothetical protein
MNLAVAWLLALVPAMGIASDPSIEHKLISEVVGGVHAGRRVSVDAQICVGSNAGGAMTGAHRANVTASHPRWRAVTADHAPKISAKSAALVVAAALMWLIVIASITVV